MHMQSKNNSNIVGLSSYREQCFICHLPDKLGDIALTVYASEILHYLVHICYIN